jgi:hypothetical protein
MVELSRCGQVTGFWRQQRPFLDACNAARDAKFPGITALAPFPVHGLEVAMGHRRSWIGSAVLMAIAVGAVACWHFFIQSSVLEWPINVSGKPYNSPQFWLVPILETALLAGALVNLLSCFHACRLAPPLPGAPPVCDPRTTDDHFCLILPACGDRYTVESLARWLENHGAETVEVSHA